MDHLHIIQESVESEKTPEEYVNISLNQEKGDGPENPSGERLEGVVTGGGDLNNSLAQK